MMMSKKTRMGGRTEEIKRRREGKNKRRRKNRLVSYKARSLVREA